MKFLICVTMATCCTQQQKHKWTYFPVHVHTNHLQLQRTCFNNYELKRLLLPSVLSCNHPYLLLSSFYSSLHFSHIRPVRNSWITLCHSNMPHRPGESLQCREESLRVWSVSSLNQSSWWVDHVTSTELYAKRMSWN